MNNQALVAAPKSTQLLVDDRVARRIADRRGALDHRHNGSPGAGCDSLLGRGVNLRRVLPDTGASGKRSKGLTPAPPFFASDSLPAGGS